MQCMNFLLKMKNVADKAMNWCVQPLLPDVELHCMYERHCKLQVNTAAKILHGGQLHRVSVGGGGLGAIL